MNNILCISPIDLSTQFLKPIVESLSLLSGVTLLCGDSTDDEFYEKLESYLKDTCFSTIVFLGHGTKSMLYGSNLNILLDTYDLGAINDKSFILFSCYSKELLSRIDAHSYIGFGFIPSGLDDVRDQRFLHNVDLSILSDEDWENIRRIYCEIWLNAIQENNGLLNLKGLGNKLTLNINKHIVKILLNKYIPERKLYADILYYIGRDMIVKAY